MPICKECNNEYEQKDDSRGICNVCFDKKKLDRRKKKEHARVHYSSNGNSPSLSQDVQLKGKVKEFKPSKLTETIFILVFALLLIWGWQSCTRSCSSNNHTQVETNYDLLSVKKSTAACPTLDMLNGFIATGDMVSGLKAYPSCRILYSGMNIEKVLERNWSTAKVMYVDVVSGNTMVMYVSIEAVR